MNLHLKPTLLALALAPGLALANDPDADRSHDARGQAMHADKEQHGRHAQPMPDQQFLDQAHASGRMEVLGARLAQNAASDQQVRAFATTLERDHRNLNDRLRDAGASELPPHPADAAVGDHVARNVEAPPDTHPSVPPEEMTDDYVRTQLATFPEMQPLLDARGADFDRRYVQMQVKMHRKSIAKYEAVANGSGNSSQVQQLARQALPTLRQHLEQAETLSRTLGGDTAPRTEGRP